MSNEMKWVSMWGNAVSINEHRPETYGKNLTLRYPIYCPLNGTKVRINFDNYCGTESVCITRASLYINEAFYHVLFGGQESCKIEAGQQVTSDEIDVEVNAGDEMLVSFYMEDFTELRSAVVAMGPLSSGIFAVGDMTEVTDIPKEVCAKTKNFYFLNNISVYTEKSNTAVVCYGDSITAQDWPDYLTLMLKGGRRTVIRRATSGSRILREYDNITYESYGLMGKKRFLHEVPTDGADTVIIQQGINDIIHPVGTDVNPFRPMSDLPTAEELIGGLKWYIEQARTMGYKVYVGTLLPIEGWRTYAEFRNDLRNEYNNWIRTTDLIDGVIDFDKALCNPENPKAFLKEYDSGDHLHPSAAGYKRMAETAYEVLIGHDK